jgi:tetratricopeptide (TPR) repeat protein
MLWPSDTFVDFDIGLNSAIRQVRAALGDSARHSVFVETVPHHGYRFLAITSRGGIGERAHVWQEVFDAPGRLAAGSAHVPVAPTHTIALKLTAAEQLWFRSERPPHCDFREAYLRGRYYLNQATLETLLRSYHFLSLAVDKKQDSGENHAALADWYLSAGDQGLLPSHEAIGYAKVEAVQGLELEPGLAEVHACLGRIAFSECNLQRAHAEFETAARLNPSLVDPFLCCALALSYLLRQDEARQYVARARQLDPVSPRTHLAAARAAYMEGAYAAAADECHEVLALQAHSAQALYFLALAQFQMGLMESALENFIGAGRENMHHPAPLSAIATVHARQGRTADARAVLNELVEKATRAEVSPYYFAEVHLALGDVDRALEYLRRSFDLHLPDMIGIAVDPWLRSLHGRPAFDEMVASLGISSRSTEQAGRIRPA